jgi:hypothetical protein
MERNSLELRQQCWVSNCCMQERREAVPQHLQPGLQSLPEQVWLNISLASPLASCIAAAARCMNLASRSQE